MAVFAMLCCLNLLLIVSVSAAAPRSEYEVRDLPGVPPEATRYISRNYAGLLNVSGRNRAAEDSMFFWYFEQITPSATRPTSALPTNATVNSSQPRKLVIWLNGGPGCSSLNGLLAENGPFFLLGSKFHPNPASWTTLANVLYLEQPAGTGFSSVSRGTHYAANQLDVSADFLETLQRLDVQMAINVVPSWATRSKPWELCVDRVYSLYMTDNKSSTRELEFVLNSNINVTLFIGDLDFITNYAALESELAKMTWRGATGFQTPLSEMRRWVLSDGMTGAGRIASERGLDYIRFQDAGHMVPLDQPFPALFMLSRVLGLSPPPMSLRFPPRPLPSTFEGLPPAPTSLSTGGEVGEPQTPSNGNGTTVITESTNVAAQASPQSMTWVVVLIGALVAAVLAIGGIVFVVVYVWRRRRGKGVSGVLPSSSRSVEKGGVMESRPSTRMETAAVSYSGTSVTSSSDASGKGGEKPGDAPSVKSVSGVEVAAPSPLLSKDSTTSPTAVVRSVTELPVLSITIPRFTNLSLPFIHNVPSDGTAKPAGQGTEAAEPEVVEKGVQDPSEKDNTRA
ncbi:hypothetical protein HDU67_009449 [Dinochytrium kinnereticum]|nr:hypothetical protein HDU67_009449 [Dinochytrium kinnereticum]